LEENDPRTRDALDVFRVLAAGELTAEQKKDYHWRWEIHWTELYGMY
jgi:hypothetical protein